MQGIAKRELKDYAGAIDDFSKAIIIAHEFSYAYSNRGNAKRNLQKEHNKSSSTLPPIAMPLAEGWRNNGTYII